MAPAPPQPLPRAPASSRSSAWACLLALLLTSLLAGTGCEEATEGEGGPCERAQDCDSGLVCAHVTDGSDEMVCARLEDTRKDEDCMPDFPGMACGLVLLDPGASGTAGSD